MKSLQSTGTSTLGGLGGLIMNHPLATIGTVAVAGIGIAYNAYQNYKQNLIASAQEATSAWQNQNSTLEAQKQKYVELKELLDSGALDETETYDVKMQILDIQNQIVSAYGDAASELDLVNGKLESQLSLIGQISVKEAQKSLNQNRTEYKDAEKEMNKERHYYLGSTGSSAFDGDVGQDIFNVAKKYEDKGLELVGDDAGVYTIHFNGDAEQATEVINDFMTDTNDLLDKYKDNDPALSQIEDVLDYSEDSLKKSQKTLDDYQGTYETFLMMDMIAQGNEKGDPATIYNDYAKAIETYNQAVAEGDSSKIEEATEALESAQEAKEELLSGDGEKYESLFDDFNDPLEDKEVEVEVNAADNASEVINSVSEEEIREKLVELHGVDNATPYVNLWNELSADPKFSQLSAEDQASLVLETYNGLDPEDKHSLISESGGAVTQGVADAVAAAIASIPETSSNTITITTIKKNINKVINATGKALDHGAELLRNSYGGPKLLHGTAHANGYWGNPSAGRKLVGELGPEIVVTPHTSRWYTVGDNGPEFANIPKNAIVW